MNYLKEHLKYEAFYRNKKVVLTIFILAAIFYFSFNTLFPFIKKFNSNQILTLFNILLLIVTSFYAWVTYRMFLTMRDSQLIEIKPQIWIHLDNSQISKSNSSIANNEIIIPAKLENYGNGPAINMEVTATIPHKKTKNPEFNSDSVSHKGMLNTALKSSDFSFKCNFKLYMQDIEVHKKEEGFLKIFIKFEDIEKNLYQMILFYDLFKLSEDKGYWSLVYDEYYMTNYKSRRHFEDENIGVNPEKRKLLFKRTPFWWYIFKK